MYQIILISGVIIFTYFVLIISFYFGWKGIPKYNENSVSDKVFISVVIAVRNEESNLSNLLKCIIEQSLSRDLFEVILVNDHSSDSSKKVINKYRSTLNNLFLLSLPKELSGKKQAILYGVNAAKGELIVTTDADCCFSKKWLSLISNFYSNHHPDLIIGPVIMKPNNNLFSKLQALEFLSLIGSGAGASGINKPIMCNAANLAFKKDFYLNTEIELNNDYVSGDDIFLLLAAKRLNKRIQFLKAKETVVKTKTEHSFKDFVNQRLRWASKSSTYNDFFLIFTESVIFLNSLLFLILIVCAFFNIKFLILLLVIFVVKSFVDYLLLYSVLQFFKQKKLLRWFFPLQSVYFVYILYIAIASQFVKFNWKGRTTMTYNKNNTTN